MLPGTTELLIILGVTLLLFGPSKLPQLGRAIGESIRNFRKGVGGGEKRDDPDLIPEISEDDKGRGNKS